MIPGPSLILELLLLLLATSLGTCMLEAKNSSSSSLTCANIPYPFGKFGEAMKGFEISCELDGTTPILQLNSTGMQYELENISLQGYLSIYTDVIAKNCFDFENLDHRLSWIDLEGTPCTISDIKSSGNMLTVVGCECKGIIQELGGDKIRSSCVTFCNSINDVVDGSCSGEACCQASIPKGLKSFNLTVESLDIDRHFNGTPCGQAFFVKQRSFEFSVGMLQDVMHDHQISRGRYLMVLDWAIGNETCEDARKKKETYACKKNSYCYDSTNGVGYRCNRSQGYDGNPYTEDGCIDINECEDPELNPCVGSCINELGNVSCACPHGQHGDGRKQGSGCPKKEKDTTAFAHEVALGVGLSLLLILIIGSLLSYRVLKKRKLIKKKARFFHQNGGLLLQQQISSQGSNAPVKIFDIKELKKATNNFNESQILGHGGYGTVYKGVLPSQEVVAIKKSKFVNESQIEELINEIVILSQINHRNVVRLLGCCLETQVPLLVYEFMSNRTLFHHIHGESHDFSMPWEVRLKIAAEVAGALSYLHLAASVLIVHGDVKSNNILLDQNYTAKISDFVDLSSVPFDQEHITSKVRGTLGYLDPEFFHTSKLTEKSDVYSFGVVLAELLTRELPISSARSEDQWNLASYFTLMFDEQRLHHLADPQIVEEVGMEHLILVAQLSRRCLNLKGEERPTMKEVAIELQGLRRFHKQQLDPQNLKETEHSVAEIGHSNTCIEEESR